MSTKLKLVYATILSATCALVACAGSSDDTSNDGAGALSKDSKKAGTSTGVEAGAPAALTVTGDKLTIAEAVLIHDQTLNEDGTQTPTARIIFSNKAGACDRLDQGFTLAPDEKTFTVRVKQPAFSVGKVTFTSDTSSSAAVYIDNDLLCGESSTGSAKGTGTLDVATVAAGQVAGSIDITIGSRKLQGSFTAKACADGKITNNRVNCGVVQGDSVDEGGDTPATGTDPSPAPSGSSTASK